MKDILLSAASFLKAAAISAVSASHPRTAYLTGLRGYAALGVIAIHTRFGGLGDLGAFFKSLVNHGKYGVPIFFVLSGYTISLSLINRDKINLKHYWKRRAGRILPVYICLLVFAWLIGFQSYWGKLFDLPHDFLSMLAHLTFYGLLDVRYANVLGGEWSIQIEFFYYIFLPYMVILARRRIGVLALVVACYFFQDANQFMPSFPLAEHQYLEN